MVCKECGKPVDQVVFWKHSDEGAFFQATPYIAPAAVGAPPQVFTLNLHMIQPVPGPDGS